MYKGARTCYPWKMSFKKILKQVFGQESSADPEVQLMQQNHCDGVLTL